MSEFNVSGMPVRDRRQAPRLQATSVSVQVPALGLGGAVREIGFGGFSMESPIALPLGRVHEFVFALPDGDTVGIGARVVHCNLRSSAGSPPSFLLGMEFRSRRSGAERADIDRLLDSLTSSISFEIQ